MITTAVFTLLVRTIHSAQAASWEQVLQGMELSNRGITLHTHRISWNAMFFLVCFVYSSVAVTSSPDTVVVVDETSRVTVTNAGDGFNPTVYMVSCKCI